MAYTALKMRHEHRRILSDVLQELGRQQELHGGETAREVVSTTPTMALAILVEEVGEVARAILDDDALDGPVRDELVQVAAVAVAIIEGLDAG